MNLVLLPFSCVRVPGCNHILLNVLSCYGYNFLRAKSSVAGQKRPILPNESIKATPLHELTVSLLSDFTL